MSYMSRQARSGMWWLAETLLLGQILVLLILAASWEWEGGTVLIPASVFFVGLAGMLALLALVALVARPLTAVLLLIGSVPTLVAGFGEPSGGALVVGMLMLLTGGLFLADAVQRDLAPASAAPRSVGWAAGPTPARHTATKTTEAEIETKPGSAASTRVGPVTLAGIPVPDDLVAEFVQRLHEAEFDATAATLEHALETGETMPDTSSSDRFALTVPDREALLHVLDEECPDELVELRSLLRADHDSRVRSGIWAEAVMDAEALTPR